AFALRLDDVARGEPAEDAVEHARACHRRQMAVLLEVDELEAAHHRLAALEVVETRCQLARALPSEIVDPVVAVRRHTQLAEPAEHDRSGRVDVDRAKEGLVGRSEVPVTGKGGRALRGRRAPCVGDHAAQAAGVPAKPAASGSGGRRRRRARRALARPRTAAPPSVAAITHAPSCAKIAPWTVRSQTATPAKTASVPYWSSRHTRRWRPARIAANGTREVSARYASYVRPRRVSSFRSWWH